VKLPKSLEPQVLSRDFITTAPIGFVLLDGDLRVSEANAMARENYQIEPGDDFLTSVHGDDVQSVLAFLTDATATTKECIIAAGETQKSVLVTKTIEVDGVGLWLEDLSVSKALKRQLQLAQMPERKITRDLTHLANTALSYGELISMILKEEDLKSSSAHANLEKYHVQMMRYLERAANIAEQKETESPAGKRNHILIVDDEAIVVEFLSELMRSRDYKVTSFTKPLHALKAFELSPDSYDLAILDHQMPDIDGVTLADNLKTYSAQLPIVLCTGKDQVPSTHSIERVMTKPVDINQLVAVVAGLLDSSRPQPTGSRQSGDEGPDHR
jgi:CheY-like chemotaxis protein